MNEGICDPLDEEKCFYSSFEMECCNHSIFSSYCWGIWAFGIMVFYPNQVEIADHVSCIVTTYILKKSEPKLQILAQNFFLSYGGTRQVCPIPHRQVCPRQAHRLSAQELLNNHVRRASREASSGLARGRRGDLTNQISRNRGRFSVST